MKTREHELPTRLRGISVLGPHSRCQADLQVPPIATLGHSECYLHRRGVL